VQDQYYDVQHEGAVITGELCQEPCGCHKFVPWTTVSSQGESPLQGGGVPGRWGWLTCHASWLSSDTPRSRGAES
jgi:hypothetical protein